MKYVYGLYLDDTLKGFLEVEYSDPLTRNCSAQALNVQRNVVTPTYVNPSYKTVADAAQEGLERHYGFKLERRDDLIQNHIGRTALTPRDADTNWQQTRSGQRLWSFKTYPEDINLEEIAYGLRDGRFGCQTLGLYTYSVAQHSVHASLLGDQDPKAAMAKLLHDAHEAVLKDLPKPIRNQPGMEEYNAACDARQRVINVWAGLDPDAHHMYDVKEADAIMLATERRDLMAPCEYVWQKNPHEPAEKRIRIWSQPYAVLAFLKRFRELAESVCPIRVGEATEVIGLHVEEILAREGDQHWSSKEGWKL